MSKRQCYTLGEVLAEVCVDKNCDFDPDVADSLSYTSEQVCEASRQDNVEITVLRLSLMLRIRNISDILSSSFTDC